jgi:acyl carrier protein
MDTQEAVSPRTDVFAQLSAVWVRILGHPVGPDDDFFDSGGDSLTAIRMIVEVQQTYRVEIDVERFFEAPSISRLTDMVARAQSARP